MIYKLKPFSIFEIFKFIATLAKERKSASVTWSKTPSGKIIDYAVTGVTFHKVAHQLIKINE